MARTLGSLVDSELRNHIDPGQRAAARAILNAAGNNDGIGTVAAVTGLGIDEYGDAAMKRSVFTFTAMSITLTDDAGVGQWGTVKLYDFPAGNIYIIGATIDADLTLVNALWLDTAVGDIGVGSTANADATAIATTRQNIIASTAIAAMVAQVGPVDCGSVVPVGLANAGGTDTDCILNVRIDDDAAHITDSGTLTGTMVMTWTQVGDF